MIKHWSLAAPRGAPFTRLQPQMRVCDEISSDGALSKYIRSVVEEAVAAKAALPPPPHTEL
jgi:hypothetical protein